jgi:hypothetical protein
MKVKITKPVLVECLEGSIVEMTEKQYKLAKKYCEPIIENKIENPEQTIQKKTRKGKK